MQRQNRQHSAALIFRTDHRDYVASLKTITYQPSWGTKPGFWVAYRLRKTVDLKDNFEQEPC